MTSYSLVTPRATSPLSNTHFPTIMPKHSDVALAALHDKIKHLERKTKRHKGQIKDLNWRNAPWIASTQRQSPGVQTPRQQFPHTARGRRGRCASACPTEPARQGAPCRRRSERGYCGARYLHHDQPRG